MKWILMLALSVLLSACGCRYNGIDTREVLTSSSPMMPSFERNDNRIDVTADQIIYTR